VAQDLFVASGSCGTTLALCEECFIRRGYQSSGLKTAIPISRGDPVEDNRRTILAVPIDQQALLLGTHSNLLNHLQLGIDRFYFPAAADRRATALSVRLPGSIIVRENEHDGRRLMAVARVTKITASSPKGFKTAVEEGMKRATKTLRGITGFEVTSLKGKVEKGKITEYRATMDVTFILD
jgi:dodecin